MFTLKIKKMFYNEEMNFLDNEVLVTKKMAINPDTKTVLE